MTSGKTILRPAAHMPVNSWHRAQKPSRVATGSRVDNPQSGHDQPTAPGWRTDRSRARRNRLGPPTRSLALGVLELAARNSDMPGIGAASLVMTDPAHSLAVTSKSRSWLNNLHRKSHESCRARHPSAGGCSSARFGVLSGTESRHPAVTAQCALLATVANVVAREDAVEPARTPAAVAESGGQIRTGTGHCGRVSRRARCRCPQCGRRV
jgi:hypothetical protein